MILENLVFVVVQGAPADEAKVGDVLFIFENPNGFSLPAGIRLQRNAAHVFFLRSTVAKPRIASAEHRPKHTVARGRRARPAGSKAETVTERAGLLSKGKSFGSSPVHFFLIFPSTSAPC